MLIYVYKYIYVYIFDVLNYPRADSRHIFVDFGFLCNIVEKIIYKVTCCIAGSWHIMTSFSV